MSKLSIKIGSLLLFAETSNENPATLKAILEKLPLIGEAQRWGEEIYFFVPFSIAQESPRQQCKPGEIAFWPEGPGIAIFFGKTPISKGNEPVAFSPCNFFAKLQTPIDKIALNAVEPGTKIVLDKANNP